MKIFIGLCILAAAGFFVFVSIHDSSDKSQPEINSTHTPENADQ